MSKEPLDEDVSARVRRAEELVVHLIARMEIYHAHKETMAHSGLLVMLALLGGVISATPWPPRWVPHQLRIPLLSIVLSQRWVTFIGLLLLWLSLHIYIRWQLGYKREAAIIQAGAERALAEWVAREPRDSDLGKYSPKEGRYTCALWKTILDLVVIPFPRATIVLYKNFPKWLGDAIEQEEQDWKNWKKKKKTVINFISKGESLEWAGSCVIFFVMILRTFDC